MRKAIFVLPLLSLFNPILNPLSAAIAEEVTADADEVLVTGSPLGRTTETFTRPANLLAGDALKDAAGANLGETLSNEAGLASASFGPGVGLPIIRGQTDNRVKVMQDSISSMDASSASPDHAITLEPLLATRIEVLRGPAALRYGSGAVGGVVNVLNDRIPESSPKGFEGALETRFNSANDEAAGILKLKGGGDNFALYADGVSRTSNNLRIPGNSAIDPETALSNSKGYIANTNADYKEGTLGGSYLMDDGFIGLSINHLTNNYGVPPSEDALVRIDMKQTREDMKGEWRNLNDGIEKVSFRLGHNDYEHTEMEDGQPGTQFTNKAYEGRAELVHSRWGNWQGAVGLQAASSDFAAIGEEAFIPASRIQNQGVFWLEEADFDPITLELGVRGEHQSIAPEGHAERRDTAINLSSSLSWKLDDHQKLSASLARSERAPSVEELFSNGPHPATASFLVGDEKLNKETSLNTELGYHWHDDAIEFSTSLFYNKIADYIYANNMQEEAEEGLTLYHYQQADAAFVGGELEFHYKANDQWTLGLVADSVRAKLDSGEDLPRIPSFRWGGSVEFEQGQFQAGLNLRISADQKHAGPYELATAGYSRLDANISYHISEATRLYLKGNNLLNEEIRNATSYLRAIAPEAGRNWTIGLEQQF